MSERISTGMVVIVVFVVAVLAMGVFLAPKYLKSGSQAVGELKKAEVALDKAEQDNENLAIENKGLQEQNGRLREQLAAATKGGSITVEQQQRSLDTRAAELDNLAKRLTSREVAVTQDEEKVDKLRNEFHEKTNIKMEDLGRAMQVKEEYDEMKSARDAAQNEAKEARQSAVAEASQWLKFIWGVSIALALSIMVIVVLLYRSISLHVAERRETEYRREVANLLNSTITASMDEQQRRPVIKAFHSLAGLPYVEPDGTEGHSGDKQR